MEGDGDEEEDEDELLLRSIPPHLQFFDEGDDLESTDPVMSKQASADEREASCDREWMGPVAREDDGSAVSQDEMSVSDENGGNEDEKYIPDVFTCKEEEDEIDLMMDVEVRARRHGFYDTDGAGNIGRDHHHRDDDDGNSAYTY